jgi:hypothetical protein
MNENEREILAMAGHLLHISTVGCRADIIMDGYGTNKTKQYRTKIKCRNVSDYDRSFTR